jgi:nicotinamidase-related amidase
MAPSRSPDLLSAAESLLLVIDVQERLMPHIAGGEAVEANCVRLLRAAELFGVLTVVSEQYPRGLGATVGKVTAAASSSAATKIEKLRFSAAEATGWPPAGEREDGRHHVVIAGVETHVCVLQTAFDLLSRGYRVFVAADATGSRRDVDYDVALNRLRDGGAAVVTTESVLFEWCEAAGTEAFRAVRDLVKGSMEEEKPGRG